MKVNGIELEDTRRLKKNLKNLDGLLNYCNLKFQPLEGVNVCEHWLRLAIFLNIFISGDKMIKQNSVVLGVQKFIFSH